MAREEYNQCMIPWIKGKEGLDRRLSFCAGAKLCSGKAQTLDEAKQICSDRFAKKGNGSKLFNCKCLNNFDKKLLIDALVLMETDIDDAEMKRIRELKVLIVNTPDCKRT